jgi:hypothetical protein
MNPSGVVVAIFAALVIAQVTVGGALERLGIIKPSGG